MRTDRPARVALAALGIAACSQGETDALDTFPDRVVEVTCAKAYECCTPMELAGHMSYGTDVASCQKEQRGSYSHFAGQIRQSQKKGRATYDDVQLAACLAEMRAQTCAELRRNPPTGAAGACDRFLVPQVAAGGPCGQDGDCVGGSCQGADGDTDGICVTLATDGASCKGASCATGHFCDPAGETCRPKRADGEACSLHLECATGGCHGGNPDAGVKGTCGEKGGPGTTCHVQSGCALAGPPSPLALAPTLGLLFLSGVHHRRTRRRRFA